MKNEKFGVKNYVVAFGLSVVAAFSIYGGSVVINNVPAQAEVKPAAKSVPDKDIYDPDDGKSAQSSLIKITDAKKVEIEALFKFADEVDNFSYKIYDTGTLMGEGKGFTSKSVISWESADMKKPPSSLKYVFKVNGKTYNKTVKFTETHRRAGNTYKHTTNYTIKKNGVSN